MGPFLPGPGPLAPTPHNLSSGPTTYNQSVSGALSFAGASPLFAMNRTITGSLSFTGSTPLFVMQRLLTATLTPAGVVKRSAARILAGSLSFSGAAVTRAVTRLLAASITTTATLKRSTSRNLLGSITPTGIVTSTKVLFRTLTGAAFRPTATLAGSRAFLRTIAAALNFLGGAQLWPNDALYPGENLWPYGGHILFNLNRLLPAALTPSGTLLGHGSNTRLFTAVLQPHVVFLKTSARVILAASFSSASLIGVRASHTVAQALFASLRNAGSLSTGINPSFIPTGGGGYGLPMPDSFFQRYQPTLRRQKMRV